MRDIVKMKFSNGIEMLTDEGMVHCQGAVMGGEYDVPAYKPEKPPHILDIGANFGAFCLWAATRWPGCTLDAYEPNPEVIPHLRKNIEGIADQVTIHDVAIGYEDTKINLDIGMVDSGCVTSVFVKTPNQVLVEQMDAAKLPACNILKIDAEGIEPLVLERYLPKHRPDVIVLEFHRFEQLREIVRMCKKLYVPVRSDIYSWDTGILRMVKR